MNASEKTIQTSNKELKRLQMVDLEAKINNINKQILNSTQTLIDKNKALEVAQTKLNSTYFNKSGPEQTVKQALLDKTTANASLVALKANLQLLITARNKLNGISDKDALLQDQKLEIKQKLVEYNKQLDLDKPQLQQLTASVQRLTDAYGDGIGLGKSSTALKIEQQKLATATTNMNFLTTTIAALNKINAALIFGGKTRIKNKKRRSRKLNIK